MAKRLRLILVDEKKIKKIHSLQLNFILEGTIWQQYSGWRWAVGLQ